MTSDLRVRQVFVGAIELPSRQVQDEALYHEDKNSASGYSLQKAEAWLENAGQH